MKYLPTKKRFEDKVDKIGEGDPLSFFKFLNSSGDARSVFKNFFDILIPNFGFEIDYSPQENIFSMFQLLSTL